MPIQSYCDSTGVKWSVFMNRLFNILISVVFLVSCSSTKKTVPIEDLDQPPSREITTHVVAKGETLYSIAWRYGLDYRILARANNIGANYRIVPGQVLYLRPELNGQLAQSPSKQTVKSTQSVVAKPAEKTVKKTSVSRSRQLTELSQRSASGSREIADIRWVWPSPGVTLSRFIPGNPDAEGIDIATKKGESVSAAANGIVVYAGEGLRGYGKLLIIKHNKQFLSAYAHADQILVEEGRQVQAGQKVAEIGSSGTEKAKLYFEIRKGGKPVDPLHYLPRR